MWHIKKTLIPKHLSLRDWQGTSFSFYYKFRCYKPNRRIPEIDTQ